MNTELEEMVKRKRRMIIWNKADLAEESTRRHVGELAQQLSYPWHQYTSLTTDHAAAGGGGRKGGGGSSGALAAFRKTEKVGG